MRIFVDLDGCLAKWDNFNKTKEDYTAVGFYEDLDVQKNLLEALNSIIDDVYIISHYVDGFPHAIREKKTWLSKHMPNLKPSHIHIIERSREKFTVLKKLSTQDILIDDFNGNLLAWENAGGTSIKFVNRCNDRSKSWNGERIYYNYSVQKILDKLRTE